MSDRKAELARLCRLEIRKTSALMKMALAEFGYHIAEPVIDAEIAAMSERITEESLVPEDVEILGNLVLADLWPRLKQAHRKQRENVFGHMKAMYPATISQEAEFAFDIGWKFLLQDAAVRIQTYPSTWKALIVGGKEKFGCLVLHIACDYNQPGCRSEVERLREEVRLRSLATCDICGNSGRLRIGSVAKTVCDKHGSVLGEMRDDDGMWADPWKWHTDDEAADVQPGLVGSAVSRQIEIDIADRTREAEIILHLASNIDTAVAAALIADEEDIRGWVRSEVERWRNGFPLSEDEAAWLRTYVRSLVIDELGRRHGYDDPE